MSGKYFQRKITAGRYTLPVAIIVAAMIWIASFVFLSDSSSVSITYPFRDFMESLPAGAWLDRLLSFSVYLLIGYLLIELNNRFAIIKVRASMQTSLFVLFIAACPTLHAFYPGDVVSLVIAFSLYLLFCSYRHHKPSEYIFHSFVFFGVGTLLFPQTIYLAPMLLLGAFFFKSLTARSFFAAILGFATPYWFLFAYAFYFDRMDLFYFPFTEMATIQPFRWDAISYGEWVSVGFFLIILIVSSIHCFVHSFEDKFRARVFLRFIISLSFYVFLYMILQPAYALNFRAIWLIGISILAGHFFVHTSSKASNLFFICVIIGSFLLSGFNIWMLL